MARAAVGTVRLTLTPSASAAASASTAVPSGAVTGTEAFPVQAHPDAVADTGASETSLTAGRLAHA